MEVWDKQMRTITYRTDKQQGPSVEHRELYSIFYDKPQWKKNIKKDVYLCITESLLYSRHLYNANQVHFTIIKF